LEDDEEQKVTTPLMSPLSDRQQPMDQRTALIGVDWGTSSLRAYRLDLDGQVLGAKNAAKGILHVEGNAFAEVLDELIGPWRRPGLPVVLSGMIGSRQGWFEVPYLDVPASLDDIAKGLIHHPDDRSVHIVPGLAFDPPGAAPDVMRGEETQIIGAVDSIADDGAGRHLLVMPGTHSKWVLIEEARIVWFATFMTGELFSVLKDHSILGRLMRDDSPDHDDKAFEQGLVAATTLPGGLLQQLFSVRTLGLFERVPETAIASYLSGLLIGNEIASALGSLGDRRDPAAITVIGASTLAEHYMKAIGHAGHSCRVAGENAAARGHFLLAKAAHILTETIGSTP
jgi:2-dehydro-3-deoxygalactonokinase